jgi:hypothetical protein
MIEWGYGRLVFADIWFNLVYIASLGIGLSLIAINRFDKFASK